MNITKERYYSLRKTTRSIIMLNSCFVDTYRISLEHSIVLMGGVVVKKEDGRMIVFDFSGTFEIDLDAGARRGVNLDPIVRFNEGDVLFVFGAIYAINGPEGFFLFPYDAYSLEEIISHPAIRKEDIILRRKRLKDIATINIAPGEAMSCAKNPHEVVQFYIKDGEESDCFDLTCAAYDYYRRFPCAKNARIVVRYYMLCVKRMKFKWEMFHEIFPMGGLEESGEEESKTE